MSKKKVMIGATKLKGGSKVISKIKRDQILEFHNSGKSGNEIARKLQCSPHTVRKYIKNKDTENRLGPIGIQLDAVTDLVRKLFFLHGRNCKVVQEKLKEQIKLWFNIRTLERFCKKYREEWIDEQRKVREKIENAPGDQIQKDFGQLPVNINGTMVLVHVFVAVLSYSRRIFAKAYVNECTATWLDGLESAFHFFNGIPRVVIVDNTKCLVTDHYADITERFNEKFEHFCRYYNIIPIATSPYSPQSKGKVERAVRYVKENAFAGRSFESMDALNMWLEEWSLKISDNRVLSSVGLTGETTPIKRFDLERRELRPINRAKIANCRIEKRKVDKNGLIRIDNALYKLPKRLAEKNVQILIGSDEIRILGEGRTPYVIDKARDAYTPIQQGPSNVATSEEEYDAKVEEFKKDPNWNRMQKRSRYQREAAAYNVFFNGGGKGDGDEGNGPASQGNGGGAAHDVRQGPSGGDDESRVGSQDDASGNH